VNICNLFVPKNEIIVGYKIKKLKTQQHQLKDPADTEIP
jgi:hypothetical protein